jgi:hypothetical protein
MIKLESGWDRANPLLVNHTMHPAHLPFNVAVWVTAAQRPCPDPAATIIHDNTIRQHGGAPMDTSQASNDDA